MEINIAKTSGFCFGVRRAINTSLRLADKKTKVYILGDIVHNNFIVRELGRQGLKKINRIKPAPPNSTLIISAHGAPEKTFAKAKSAGYKIVDVTCPKVKDIYKIAKSLEKNNKIIIIGDINHQEVKGISGQLKKKALVIDSVRNLPLKQLRQIKKAAVVTQSTQTLDNINKIMSCLKKIIPEVNLYNTVCRTTLLKQQEIKTLPKENGLVLIVGSATSANTKRLYEISRAINKKTYWIEDARNLRKIEFRGIKTVGIMAGASTPDTIVEKIVKKLSILKG